MVDTALRVWLAHSQGVSAEVQARREGAEGEGGACWMEETESDPGRSESIFTIGSCPVLPLQIKQQRRGLCWSVVHSQSNPCWEDLIVRLIVKAWRGF